MHLPTSDNVSNRTRSPTRSLPTAVALRGVVDVTLSRACGVSLSSRHLSAAETLTKTLTTANTTATAPNTTNSPIDIPTPEEDNGPPRQIHVASHLARTVPTPPSSSGSGGSVSKTGHSTQLVGSPTPSHAPSLFTKRRGGPPSPLTIPAPITPSSAVLPSSLHLTISTGSLISAASDDSSSASAPPPSSSAGHPSSSSSSFLPFSRTAAAVLDSVSTGIIPTAATSTGATSTGATSTGATSTLETDTVVEKSQKPTPIPIVPAFCTLSVSDPPPPVLSSSSFTPSVSVPSMTRNPPLQSSTLGIRKDGRKRWTSSGDDSSALMMMIPMDPSVSSKDIKSASSTTRSSDGRHHPESGDSQSDIKGSSQKRPFSNHTQTQANSSHNRGSRLIDLVHQKNAHSLLPRWLMDLSLSTKSATYSTIPPSREPRATRSIIKLLDKRFKDIERFSDHDIRPPQYSMLDSQRGFNLRRNRYMDILPFDYNRVRLQSPLAPDGSDYINASYIEDHVCSQSGTTDALHSTEHKQRGHVVRFIAAQGPLDRTSADFWQMVWEQDVPIIVNLTSLEERGFIKCHAYWPTNLGSSMSWNTDSNHNNQPSSINVTLLEHYIVSRGKRRLYHAEEHDSYPLSERVFAVTWRGVSKKVVHLYFQGWPDHSSTDIMSVLYTVWRMNWLLMNRTIVPGETHRNAPVVVHCSAGCGRTGSFIALDCILRYFGLNNSLSGSERTISPSQWRDRATEERDLIEAVVRDLRTQRIYSVQTSSQYLFLYDAIATACMIEADQI